MKIILLYTFFKKLGIIDDMSIRVGPWDPLQLSFQIMDVLLKKGTLTIDEAKEIMRKTLPEDMPADQKEAIINSMIVPR